MQKIYLVCGVSGSGKSWACRQVTEKFHYIPHDRCWTHPSRKSWDPSLVWAADMKDDSRYLPGAKSNHVEVVMQAAAIASKPILTECPFAEREVKSQLEAVGCKVIPIFVVEPPDTVRRRYQQREGKPCPTNVLTRATSIGSRAAEWRAFRGTSDEVLSHLKEMVSHE